MTYKDWNEHDIQALKAQEAKDLAAEFLSLLNEKNRGPISPGEVQLQELEYELKLKEAESADKKADREHELRIKELELEIERERARVADVQRKADEVRQELRELVDRVRQSEESLGVSLERVVREHRLKLEQLESEYAETKSQLDAEHDQLVARRDKLAGEIGKLAAIQESAEDLQELREAVERHRGQCEQQRRELEDELATLEFEKTKQLTETRRSQELELARLQTDHEKEVLRLDREAAEKIVAAMGMRIVASDQWNQLESELKATREELDAQREVDASKIADQIRRQYNITMDEPLDVTDLFYQHRAATQQLDVMRGRIEKLETELTRGRQHIEQEPQRIATAVEAARTQVQNIVEPAGKR